MMKMLKTSPLLLVALTAFACDSESEDDSSSAAATGVAVMMPPAGAASTTPAATAGDSAATTGTETGAGTAGTDPEPAPAALPSGPTFLSDLDGLTTYSVNPTADGGGTSYVVMTEGETAGELCFEGKTGVFSTTTWGMSIAYTLAPETPAGSSFDGTDSDTIDFSVSGTAPGLQVGLSDITQKAPNGVDKLFFWAPAAVGTNSVNISDLAQPNWTIAALADGEDDDGNRELKTNELGLIGFQIAASETEEISFDFCIVNPVLDNFVRAPEDDAEDTAGEAPVDTAGEDTVDTAGEDATTAR
jgi:hypothetical protein